MGDSDDDVEYKRRDKFRSERRGYDGGGSPPPRGEYRDARPGPPGGGSGYRRSGGYEGGGGYRGGGGGGRDRYSPPPHRRHSEMSPPAKRMRGGDWDDGYGRGGGGYDRGYHDRFYERPHNSHRGHYGGGHHRGGPPRGGPGGGGHRGGDSGPPDDMDGVQPVMMSFKAFLGTQDDSISDEDAIKKYAEYKMEFKRQQLNEFFVSHKDEEWFKLKYHPEESVKRRNECKAALEKRVQVFMDFLKQGKYNGITVDGDKSDSLVRLLDSVVIMLEGGSEFDLQILDRELEEARKAEEKKKREAEEAAKKEEAEKAAKGEAEADASKESGDGKKDDDNMETALTEEQKKAKALLEGGDGENKRKRKRNKEFDDDESGSSSSEDDDEAPPPGMDAKKDDDVKEEQESKDEAKMEDTNGHAEPEVDGGEKKEEAESEADKMATEEKEDEEDDSSPKPRALHRTASIFLRNLAPTITKQEVEAMCKKYPGFLRAAIADPASDRRWFRRGWITFERDVKIKEICYSLNSIRLRDFELGAIVNRDLSRRIRTVQGITVDKKIVRNDIKLAAKVVTNLDKKWDLWQEKKSGNDSNEDAAAASGGILSNNPLLSNITDYLIEEASAEEEELLGKNDLEEGEEGEEGNKISRDEDLITVLDKLVLYLRIVHSVDFYNHSEYPSEDEMPNRCGILHARGLPPASNVTTQEIEDYNTTFEKKMGSFLQPKPDLTDDEAGKLGMKNENDEVEKFVQANTQELGKDKWLCPLSGKKFKGPDFVRKHIFNKHAEKIEEVKKEVQYYNNYLKDPKRPQLPEVSKPSGGGAGDSGGRRRESGGHPGRGGDPYQYSGMPREATNYPIYDEPRGYREPRYDRGGGGYGGHHHRGRPHHHDGGYGGRGGGNIHDRVGLPPRPRHDQNAYGGRPIITYRDLDAPRDYDEF